MAGRRRTKADAMIVSYSYSSPVVVSSTNVRQKDQVLETLRNSRDARTLPGPPPQQDDEDLAGARSAAERRKHLVVAIKQDLLLRLGFGDWLRAGKAV
ncbi:hypothetical protein CBR64_20535 [Cellulosimicrobium cellulans]|uniref:Uncharacterized protein n=2 Tax=Cellulosimicrobium cellulans TaxID=1710 RepID=A0A1Y0HZ44_CELCE|nr:hypothetical protein CBR64_20535 [Cellulosimicrobium cellulans]